ncbi:hypothetical protein [Conexibacter sp. DBS9H8]|uniref:hypothetical protein n=1 Tax=Conexibacter sp. DBS9H8 TaxID=2937801 RepID=UPI00200C0989|nr:hypothetical protein [Conexibacter sp. DBS9H8]
MIAFLLVLAVALGVCVAVASPWRWRRGEVQEGDARERSAQLAVRNLEAARDAKYAEIRDARLDLETGKLSQVDFDAVDGGLRAEAVEILRRLDRARARLERARTGTSDPAGDSGADDDADAGVEPAFPDRDGPTPPTERTGAGSYHQRPT